MSHLLRRALLLQSLHETVSAPQHLLGSHGLGGLGTHLLSLSAQGGGLLLSVGPLLTTASLVLGTLAQVGVPPQVVDVQHPTVGVQVHHLVDGVAQQLDVVRDDDEATGIGPQVVTQPQDRVVVQVVGRLVQQEGVRLLEEHPGQLDASSLATGQGPDLLIQDPVRQAQRR